jgi:hypothetical protein
LRLPPSLRTGQASFPASGSSLHNRPFGGTGFHNRLLCCLHDTRLGTAHDTLDLDANRSGPCRRFCGRLHQSRIRNTLWAHRTSKLRHLLFLLSRLNKLSRDGRPRGSQLAFAPGMSPVSDRLPAGIRFLRDLVPAFLSAHLTARFPQRGGVRAYHVPRMYLDGLGPAFTPVTTLSATGPRRGPCSESRTFWFKPSALRAQHHRLVYITALLSAVYFHWPYHLPDHPTTGAGSHSSSSRLGCPHYEKATLSRGLHTAGLLQPHASVGSRGRTPGQFLMDPPTKFSEFRQLHTRLRVAPATYRYQDQRCAVVGSSAHGTHRWPAVLTLSTRWCAPWVRGVLPDLQSRPACPSITSCPERVDVVVIRTYIHYPVNNPRG